MISEIYNVDCLQFMKEQKENAFDLGIIDTPYGINFAKTHTGNGWIVRESKEWDKETPSQEYWDCSFRITKNQIIWGGNYLTTFLPPSQGWIFWDKGQRDFSLADGELAYTSFNRALRVFEFARGKMHAEYKKNNQQKFHPTTKPVALYKWLLNNYAKAGDKIFDSHMGSQSSRIACHQLGFDYWGCELDEDYFKAGCERFKRETAQQQLFAC